MPPIKGKVGYDPRVKPFYVAVLAEDEAEIERLEKLYPGYYASSSFKKEADRFRDDPANAEMFGEDAELLAWQRENPIKKLSEQEQNERHESFMAECLAGLNEILDENGHLKLAPKEDPTPEQDEASLATIFATLAVLNGASDDDVAFLFQKREPNAERTAKLDKLVCRALCGDSAVHFAYNPKLADELLEDAKIIGIAGEEILVQALYLVGTSRILDKPLSALVQGPSASGKSYAVMLTSQLFPPEERIEATTITAQALYYAGDTLQHKLIIGGELSHKQDSESRDITSAIRQLKTEGRISKLVTVKEDGQFVTKNIVVEGPIACIETTTIDTSQLFEENTNRVLLLKTDETECQTKLVLLKSASTFLGKEITMEAEQVLKKHHDFQRSLKKFNVVIPFANEIVESLPTTNIEVRRIAGQILYLIATVTLLHQHQRKQNDKGNLIAEHSDYLLARKILNSSIRERLSLSPLPQAFLGSIDAFLEENQTNQFSGADAKKLCVESGASERTSTNYLNQLLQAGLIIRLSERKGPLPAIYQRTNRNPESLVLPDLKEQKEDHEKDQKQGKEKPESRKKTAK